MHQEIHIYLLFKSGGYVVSGDGEGLGSDEPMLIWDMLLAGLATHSSYIFFALQIYMDITILKYDQVGFVDIQLVIRSFSLY